MESVESKELKKLISMQPQSNGWKLQATDKGALFEAERRFTIEGEIKVISEAARRKLVPLAGLGLKPKEVATKNPGQVYLSRFLKLLEYINTKCPWCSARFQTNDLMLCKMVACLLPFVVENKETARAHGDRLKNLIRPDLKGSNILWITNRQQGKPPKPLDP